MTTEQIIALASAIILGIAFIYMSIVWNLQNRKYEKKIKEYDRYCDFLSKRESIAHTKDVDFRRLKESRDYLTYNSKVNSDDRRLTEIEFDVLKKDYLFYISPITQFYLAENKETKK